jgi:hypothetical protein
MLNNWLWLKRPGRSCIVCSMEERRSPITSIEKEKHCAAIEQCVHDVLLPAPIWDIKMLDQVFSILLARGIPRR